jgi:hypothetical protein
MSRLLKGLLPGLVLSLVYVTTASADPGTGAQVINYDYCQPSGSVTLCAHGHSVYTTTPTPSGNVSLGIEDSYYYSVDGPDCHYDNTGQDHEHALLTQDEFQQSHVVQSFDINSSCFGMSEHCTFYDNVAFTNGEARAYKYEYVCEPV